MSTCNVMALFPCAMCNASHRFSTKERMQDILRRCPCCNKRYRLTTVTEYPVHHADYSRVMVRLHNSTSDEGCLKAWDVPKSKLQEYMSGSIGLRDLDSSQVHHDIPWRWVCGRGSE